MEPSADMMMPPREPVGGVDPLPRGIVHYMQKNESMERIAEKKARDGENRRFHSEATTEGADNAAELLLAAHCARTEAAAKEAELHSFSDESEYPAPLVAWMHLNDPIKHIGPSRVFTMVDPVTLVDSPDKWNPDEGSAFIALASKEPDPTRRTLYRMDGWLGYGNTAHFFSAIRTLENPPPGHSPQRVAIRIEPLMKGSVISVPNTAREQGSGGPYAWTTFAVGQNLDWFVRYAMQRMYGGCLAGVACLYDVFLLSVKTSMQTQHDWYKCSVTELMTGSIPQLLKAVHSEQVNRSLDDLRRPEQYDRRAAVFFQIAVRMARCLLDLDGNRVYRTDLKPENFLYKMASPNSGQRQRGTWFPEIKLSEFGASKFGSYGVDSAMSFIGPITGASASDAAERATAIEDRDLRERMAMLSATTDGAVTEEANWEEADLRGFMRGGPSPATQAGRTMFSPPEFLEIAARASEVAKRPGGDEALTSARWYSRMMAYQLVAILRSIALDMGLCDYFFPGSMCACNAIPTFSFEDAGTDYIVAVVAGTGNKPELKEVMVDSGSHTTIRSLSHNLAVPKYSDDKATNRLSCVSPGASFSKSDDTWSKLSNTTLYKNTWAARVRETLQPPRGSSSATVAAANAVNELFHYVLAPNALADANHPDLKFSNSASLCIIDPKTGSEWKPLRQVRPTVAELSEQLAGICVDLIGAPVAKVGSLKTKLPTTLTEEMAQ